jgi:hypothetical protein
VTGVPASTAAKYAGDELASAFHQPADGAREVWQARHAAFVRVTEGRHVHAIGAHVERPRGQIAQA